MNREMLLQAYDDQLRGERETAGAVSVTSMGPLLLVDFGGGQGFVTYKDLGDADAAEIARLVVAVLDRFRADPAFTEIEWKARSHDATPGLDETLTEAGFVRGEPESIMVGDAAGLAVDVPLPAGVSIRRIWDESDVRAMCAMQDRTFGDEVSDSHAEAILRRLADDDGMELWVAEAEGRIVSAGRIEPVAGTEFAGIWGGATLEPWRRKGIYRALTAKRARSALALGKRYLQSDSTEYSRPILERSGLVKVSTTTPYVWTR